MFINRSKRRERGRAIDKERGLNRSIEWNSVVTIINYIVSTCTNIICSRHLIITIDDDNSIGSRPFAPVARISRLLRQLISPRIKVKAGEEDVAGRKDQTLIEGPAIGRFTSFLRLINRTGCRSRNADGVQRRFRWWALNQSRDYLFNLHP